MGEGLEWLARVCLNSSFMTRILLCVTLESRNRFEAARLCFIFLGVKKLILHRSFRTALGECGGP